MRLEHAIRNMKVGNFPGANTPAMCQEIREKITAMIKADAWDSKNNIHVVRTLTESGGSNNEECSNPMFDMLRKVKEVERQTEHMTFKEKNQHMAGKKVGWDSPLVITWMAKMWISLNCFKENSQPTAHTFAMCSSSKTFCLQNLRSTFRQNQNAVTEACGGSCFNIIPISFGGLQITHFDLSRGSSRMWRITNSDMSSAFE